MFSKEFIRNPRIVGAIKPSGKYLAKEMIKSIDFKNARVIIEYGPGTGVFTEKILSRITEDTKVILIEINNDFYKTLKDEYGHKSNVIVINDSAENIENILKKYNIEQVDYIISGLPFASLPKEVSNKILNITSRIIKNKGIFITFQYSLMKLKLIRKYFENINYKREVRNLPPAYVIRCYGGSYE